ncbi:MAG: peptide MFS transporter [Candidatus Nanopelagicales bacterium]
MTADAFAGTPDSAKTFFGQPRGLATLFMTEMWERFSFYGMRALLVLYLTAPQTQGYPPGPGLGFSDGDAAAIYGSYNALVYVLPLAGGWLADKIWGARRSVLAGGIIIAAGHFSMALPAETMFWLGLLLIAGGTGLLKPNISAIVGHLYTPDDTRRDAGFSIFYMGINLGAFLAPLVTGYLQINYGWHWGFAAAGIGMCLGLVQYVLGRKNLGDAGMKPSAKATPAELRKAGRIALISTAVVAAVAVVDAVLFGWDAADVTTMLTVIILVLPVIYFVRLMRAPMTPVERSRVKAFAALFLAAVVFWGIYDQAGSTLSVFTQQWIDRDVFGFEVPTAWFQSINPIFIIMFAPVFAWIWMKLANRAPSLPLKFAIAMVGIGLSFLIMLPPAAAADNGQQSSALWIVTVYLIQTWAELLLSPTGLSATTELAPAGYGSQMLALWFLAVAVGDSIAGQVLRALDDAAYTTIFAVFGIAAVLVSLVMFALIRPIRRLMSGIH